MKRLLLIFLLSAQLASATNYYISMAGSNANNGTSTATPWRDTWPIHTKTYAAGDSILFRRGDWFDGEITKTVTGAAGNPVVFGAYGTGARPIIYGDCRTSTWIPEPLKAGVYKAYVNRTFQMDAFGLNGNSFVRMAAPQGEWQYYLSNRDSLLLMLSLMNPGSCQMGYNSDTCWVYTWDGSAPTAGNTHIYRNNNLFQGSYMMVRDLDLRYFTSALQIQGVQNSTFRKITMRYSTYHAVETQGGCKNVRIDSCRVDSASATGFFEYKGTAVTFSNDSVFNICNKILDLPPTYGERCFAAMQRDTLCVWEYGYCTTGVDGAFDSGEVPPYNGSNYRDTIRYSKFLNSYGGLFLEGQFAVHNNTVQMLGTWAQATRFDLKASPMTLVRDNRFVLLNSNTGLFCASNEYGGYARFVRDTIIATGGTYNCTYINTINNPNVSIDSNVYAGSSPQWSSNTSSVAYENGTEVSYNSFASWQGTGFDAHSVYNTTDIYTGNPAPPSAPTLSSPADGATHVATVSTLTWNSVSGATEYEVQIGTGASVTTASLDGVMTGTTYGINGVNRNTTYYWRVNAIGAGGNSAWSSIRSFTSDTTGYVVPPLPVLLNQPYEGSTGVSVSPTFSWSSSSGALSYRVQASTDPTFATTAYDASTSSTSITGSGLAGYTLYWWRVAAINDGGTVWTSLNYFTTGAGGGGSAPSAPTATSASSIGSNAFVANWNSSSGATSYSLDVATDNGFTSYVSGYNGLTVSNTYQAVTGLSASTTYYYRVRAANGYGTSGNSNTISTTTGAAFAGMRQWLRLRK
jgi:hypothetical protein